MGKSREAEENNRRSARSQVTPDDEDGRQMRFGRAESLAVYFPNGEILTNLTYGFRL